MNFKFRNESNTALENIFLDKAHERAVKSLGEEEIDVRGFSGLYGEEKIQRDLRYVREKESKFAEQNNPELEIYKKMAVILEAIIHEQAELGDWFGESAFTIKTSRYDDIKSGVDTVVEFGSGEDGGETFALALDITCASSVEKKLINLKKGLDGGRLTDVEYFDSARGGKRSLRNIPKVIVDVDKEVLKNLCELWMGGRKKELGAHPVQVEILEEIRIQLEKYAEYMEKIGRNDFALIYKNVLNTIEELAEKKQGEVDLSGAEEQSGVFNSLYDNLKKFSAL